MATKQTPPSEPRPWHIADLERTQKDLLQYPLFVYEPGTPADNTTNAEYTTIDSPADLSRFLNEYRPHYASWQQPSLPAYEPTSSPASLTALTPLSSPVTAVAGTAATRDEVIASSHEPAAVGNAAGAEDGHSNGIAAEASQEQKKPYTTDVLAHIPDDQRIKHLATRFQTFWKKERVDAGNKACPACGVEARYHDEREFGH